MSLRLKVQYAAVFECIRRVTIQWMTISSYAQLQPYLPFRLISFHYRIVWCLPPCITHWPSLLTCTSFSTCSFCTSVHTFWLLFVNLHLTWSIRLVLHLLNGNLSAIFMFHTTKGILLQSIWHPYHIPSSMCPPGSHPANLSQILYFHFQHSTLSQLLPFFTCLYKDLTSSCQFAGIFTCRLYQMDFTG